MLETGTAGIESYVFGQQLGHGGMGVVYEAWLPSGQEVAIKFLNQALKHDVEAVRRFRDEAVAGSIISHPNLVPVIGRGETPDGLPYLVMARLSGEPLGTRLQRGLPSLHESALIVGQVLDGLAALHAAGIVHGDVKTDNVMVERRGDTDRAVLIDFGLARVTFERRESGENDIVSGTPAYMAPEVAAGEAAGTAADVYGACVVLYELATGHTPFEGASARKIIARQIRDIITPPSLIAPRRAIPPILERILMRGLAKDRARRPTAAALSAALHIAAPCLSGDEQTSTTAFSYDAPTIAWERSQQRMFAGGTPNRR